jgi:hypothetical protein
MEKNYVEDLPLLPDLLLPLVGLELDLLLLVLDVADRVPLAERTKIRCAWWRLFIYFSLLHKV